MQKRYKQKKNDKTDKKGAKKIRKMQKIYIKKTPNRQQETIQLAPEKHKKRTQNKEPTRKPK